MEVSEALCEALPQGTGYVPGRALSTVLSQTDVHTAQTSIQPF